MSIRAWHDKLTLPTYPLGPDDPNPPLQRHGASWAIYPYPMRDDVLEGPPTPRRYTALHIENEYLHCIVLPELGGHLYSLYDKVCRREVFYRNNVVKYGLVAVRGAWISGGIEFNFPTGHTYTTVSPVSWEIGEDQEGAWLAVGNTCRLSRMDWWVKLKLHEGERALLEEVSLRNPMPYKQRHWFWNNSAVPATDDLRLVYPARKARVAGGVVDYPVTAAGRDISWYRNHDHADDIFTLGVSEEFFGCHYQDSDFGMVNIASPWDVAGRKFFTWGTADDGMIWVDLLTDNDGQYVEIQSGRYETQSIWGFLQPQEYVSWEEWWLPEHGMGGWVWANESAVLNFEVDDTQIKLGALVTSTCEGAVLALEANGDIVWSTQMTLQPTKPFSTAIPLPRGCDKSTEFELVLSDPEAEVELIRYVHPPLHTRKPPVAETGENVVPAPRSEDECGAEELCVRATNALRQLAHGEARRLAEKALTTDEECSAAHTILGLLDCRCGLYEPARQHLERAVVRDPENAEAWQLLGLARGECGDPQEAVLALREAYRRQREGSGALSTLWDIKSRQEEATGWEPEPPDEAAAAFLEWPFYGLDQFPHRREKEVDDPEGRFAHWARGDVQNWLEQAFACSVDIAVGIIELALRRCPGADDYPMTHYCLAYWYDQLEDPTASREALARARKCLPDYCFPSRLEELEVLHWATECDASDWKAKYYLGNLLASLDRPAEAMARWREAVAMDEGFAVLHRNLGLGALKWEHDPRQAVGHYQRAIARNPADYRYYLDLTAIWSDHPAAIDPRPSGEGAVGVAEAQLTLLLAAPASVQAKWQIAARMADLRSQLGQYDAALELLNAHHFFPWEGGRHFRSTYTRSLLGRGEQAAAAGQTDRALADFEAAMQYPRNLGVGKVARPQDARIYWLAAQAAGKLGDDDRRTRYLTAAAQEPHGGPCEADCYKLFALRELGQTEEAAALETTLRDWASGLLADERRKGEGQAIIEKLDAGAEGLAS